MTGPYADIIHLPHHVSRRRRPMSVQNRAAQFAPFAALTGYDAAIAETARLTDGQIELGADGVQMLDEKLRLLKALLPRRPEVTVTYFEPDRKKAGGAYLQLRGRAWKLDRQQGILVLEEGETVPIDRIYDINGDFFSGYGSDTP